ncbi:hypothetical protein ACFWXO_07150 [Kitasatospora sp. NPDC059088]|uniref:hypothetical protein n=1 Tax=Kitasatospora sp. NPDC059088 TaxID=3346722 RepID=UPI0036B8834C
MRPRLNDDVRCVPVPEGAYLHAGHRSWVLPGAQAYEWLRRLTPHLTGRHTLDELTAPLPADKQGAVRDLVLRLHRLGFVKDAREDRPHGLAEHELREYAPEIAFLRHALDSAEHRFQRYRDTRVRLIADGPLREAALRALLRTGCRDVEVVAEPAAFTALDRFASAQRRDQDQRVHLTDGSDLPDRSDRSDRSERPELTERPRVGAVLEVRTAHEGFGAARRALLATAEHCAAAGLTPAQLLLGGAEAWFGPADAGAAASGWRRLLPPRDGEREAPLGGAVPGLLAHRLVLGLFRALTGLDDLPPAPGTSAAPTLARTDLHTLAGSRHLVLPHPAAPTSGAATPSADAHAAAAADAAADADLLVRAARVVDARTGLLGAVDEADFTQSPLWVCRAVPHGYRGEPLDVPAIGSGLERDEARATAVLAGLAAYAADATAGRAADEGRTTLQGVDLADGRPVPVPVPTAFPDRTAGQRLRGTAGGRSPEEAHWLGLADQVEALLARARGAARAGATALDPADFAADPRTGHLLRLLGTVGEPALYDLTAVTGVPACATRLGTGTVAAAGRDLAEAVARSAERALLAWQSSTEDQPGYRPEPVPPVAVPVPAVAVAVPEPAATHMAAAPDPDLAALAAALRTTTGLRAVAVPLDLDPQATAVLPDLTRVVLLP